VLHISLVWEKEDGKCIHGSLGETGRKENIDNLGVDERILLKRILKK